MGQASSRSGTVTETLWSTRLGGHREPGAPAVRLVLGTWAACSGATPSQLCSRAVHPAPLVGGWRFTRSVTVLFL